MSVLPGMSICAPYVCLIPGMTREHVEYLRTGVWLVVRHHVDIGDKTQVLYKRANVLNY